MTGVGVGVGVGVTVCVGTEVGEIVREGVGVMNKAGVSKGMGVICKRIGGTYMEMGVDVAVSVSVLVD